MFQTQLLAQPTIVCTLIEGTLFLFTTTLAACYSVLPQVNTMVGGVYMILVPFLFPYEMKESYLHKLSLW